MKNNIEIQNSMARKIKMVQENGYTNTNTNTNNATFLEGEYPLEQFLNKQAEFVASGVPYEKNSLDYKLINELMENPENENLIKIFNDTTNPSDLIGTRPALQMTGLLIRNVSDSKVLSLPEKGMIKEQIHNLVHETSIRALTSKQPIICDGLIIGNIFNFLTFSLDIDLNTDNLTLSRSFASSVSYGCSANPNYNSQSILESVEESSEAIVPLAQEAHNTANNELDKAAGKNSVSETARKSIKYLTETLRNMSPTSRTLVLQLTTVSLYVAKEVFLGENYLNLNPKDWFGGKSVDEQVKIVSEMSKPQKVTDVNSAGTQTGSEIIKVGVVKLIREFATWLAGD